MHDIMNGHVARGDLPGLVTLVCRRGEVHVDAIGHHAAGGTKPMQRDTLFRIASMTKPITAVATLILIEEGKLRLDDPVDRFLPELGGFGLSVATRRTNLFAPGRFGWDGGLGTSGYTDPAEELIGILMTQRMMDSPSPPTAFVDFWNAAYQAIDD